MQVSIKVLIFILIFSFGLVSLSFASDEEGSLWPVPDYKGDIWKRPVLTGDWGGSRSEMADKGVFLDVDVLQTFQSVESGGRSQTSEYGGSADYALKLDFGKLGLWPGGFLKVFGETQFGNSVISQTGALTASSTDALFPVPAEETSTLSSVMFTQFLSKSFGVYLGKLETLDGDLNAFASGRGKDQFLNSNFVFNPVTLRTVPYSALGGGFLYLLPKELGLLTFTALDANGTPKESGFDDAFEDTVLSSELTINVKPFGLPGHQRIGGTWSSKDFVTTDQSLRILLNLLPNVFVPPQRADDSWSLYYNFDQYLYVEPGDESQGFGLFGRFGIADENTNPIESFLSIGIGGKGVIPGRENDTFGFGYYYIRESEQFSSFITSLPGGLEVDPGTGLEFFYNMEFTGWLHVTGDVQVINPSSNRVDTTVIPGLRVKIDL